ncbi:MAG: hypothetical protein COB15_15100 [Flavobacteriales bacterium]|nr:MAG: hypothetical protein COB15_15100 [Flavobacteriales bacterium]
MIKTKPISICIILAISFFFQSNLTAQDLVISEIMYNPPEFGTDSLEFIEIYNNGTGVINLNNYTCTGGTYTFPNVNIASGSYYLLAKDTTAFNNVYGFSADGQFSSALSNAGENIVLKDDLGNVIDSVKYDDNAPFPFGSSAGQPDGGGSSIILCDVNSDNNDGLNWSASTNSVGVTINGFPVLASPGAANFCCPTLTGTVSNTICNEDTVFVNGNAYHATNSSGTETFTLTSGCDSIVTITLNVLAALSSSENSTLCFGDSIVVNGTTYNASNLTGTEVFTGVGPNMCDSTVNVSISVENAIDTSVTNTSPTLTANATGATYQWLDCANGDTVITGATNATYTAITNGSYAVVVTINGCSDTSTCIPVMITGVNNYQLSIDNYKIYPNPNNGIFTINLDQLDENTNLTVYTVVGAAIIKQEIKNNKTIINLEGYDSGIYFVKIQNGEHLITRRIIRQ